MVIIKVEKRRFCEKHHELGKSSLLTSSSSLSLAMYTMLMLESGWKNIFCSDLYVLFHPMEISQGGGLSICNLKYVL